MKACVSRKIRQSVEFERLVMASESQACHHSPHAALPTITASEAFDLPGGAGRDSELPDHGANVADLDRRVLPAAMCAERE